MRGSLVLLLVLLGAVACGGSSTSSGGDGESGTGTEGGSGGTSSGGSPTGGASGSDTGGFAGVAGGLGGDGGTSTGGSAGLPTGVCNTVDDCRLSEDCCSCFAAGPGEATRICRSACNPDSTACAREGTTAADMACISGRCVFTRTCDLRSVTCDRTVPECPAGTVPSVVGSVGDACYGPCTAISECWAVASCEVCESVGLACVTDQGISTMYHCASIPPDCENDRSCACMHVCASYEYCVDPNGTDLSCVCPVC